MHPQLFLKTFWRMELNSTIFVAMSFDDKYHARFKEVIEPAINSIRVGGTQLTAYRVDISKSGDSILSDIIEGIAHAQMILADVSSIGKDTITGEPFRNGNVMYELGLALASRHSSEVLLIRDDRDKFLFDVSTIPHKHIDFIDKKTAIKQLQEELLLRLNTRNHYNDIRIQLAAKSLSNEEKSILKELCDLPEGSGWGREFGQAVDFSSMVGIPRLLDKGIIFLAGEFTKGHATYTLSPLGRIVANYVSSTIPVFEPKEKVGVTGDEGDT